MDLKILHIEDRCTGCGACANICPKHCIALEQNEDGFYYPSYNPDNCIDCHLCEKTCHVVTQLEHETVQKDNFFLYHSSNIDTLEASTSGGVFSLLAEWVLKQGGVVYGSTYNPEKDRLEVFCTDVKPIEMLRKSKYIESYTGFAYSNVRDNLRLNRRVFYCGTPCQVRGLRQYLNTTHTDVELLLTMDFACHGVPSNLMFNEFKKAFEKNNKEVVSVDFRYKNFSKNQMWHNMTLRMGFSDGSEKFVENYGYYYYYYQPFLDNLSLRRCCYNCDIALNSDADFTVGDFWGIKTYRKSEDDNKGMSFVCVNNREKIELFKDLAKADFMELLPYEHIAYQFKDKREQRKKQLIERNDFFSEVKRYGYKKAVDRHYGKRNIIRIIVVYQIKSFIKQVIRKTLKK